MQMLNHVVSSSALAARTQRASGSRQLCYAGTLCRSQLLCPADLAGHSSCSSFLWIQCVCSSPPLITPAQACRFALKRQCSSKQQHTGMPAFCVPQAAGTALSQRQPCRLPHTAHRQSLPQTHRLNSLAQPQRRHSIVRHAEEPSDKGSKGEGLASVTAALLALASLKCCNTTQPASWAASIRCQMAALEGLVAQLSNPAAAEGGDRKNRFKESLSKGGINRDVAKQIIKVPCTWLSRASVVADADTICGQVWEESGARSPDDLRKLLLKRSASSAGVVLLQTLLDIGASLCTVANQSRSCAADSACCRCCLGRLQHRRCLRAGWRLPRQDNLAGAAAAVVQLCWPL